METVNEHRSIPPGATILGTLGVVGIFVSLSIPWSSTMDGDKTYRALDFGIFSVAYVGGAGVLVALMVAAALTRGLAKDVLGAVALIWTLAPAASLMLVERVLYGIHEEEIKDAGIDSVFMDHQGLLLGALPLFFLALAAARFAWTRRSTVCYAVAAGVSAAVTVAIPWGYLKIQFKDRAELRDIWFPGYGALGFFEAAALVATIGLAAAAALLAGRAWWPAPCALVATIVAVILVLVFEFAGMDAIGEVAGAEEVDPVASTGLPSVWALFTAVMCVCALVSGMREFRAARRAWAPVAAPALPSHGEWSPGSPPYTYGPQGYQYGHPPPNYPPHGHQPPGQSPYGDPPPSSEPWWW